MRIIPPLCLAALTSVAQAGILFSDNFDSYGNGDLIGQGNWTLKSGTTNTPQVSSGKVLSNPGTIDAIKPTTETISFDPAINPDAAGSSFYLATDINVTTAKSGSYFLHTAGSLTSSSFQSRIYLKTQGSGFVLGASVTSNPVDYGTTELALNTDYRVIVRYDINAGASNDDVSLYVFPLVVVPAIEPATAYVVNIQSSSGDASGLGAVSIRQDGNASPVLSLDNITVATTYAEAVAIPEPTSLALIGLAAGMLGRRRIRR